MYRHILCRYRILLSSFQSAVLYSSMSPTVLRGWVTFSLNIRLKFTVRANIYGPIDRGMAILQLCRWKFSHKETL